MITDLLSTIKGKKVKVLYSIVVNVKQCHLPHGITQCYLPPDTSEHTPPQPQPDRLVLDLPTPEGWKAELN